MKYKKKNHFKKNDISRPSNWHINKNLLKVKQMQDQRFLFNQLDSLYND